MPSRKRSRKKSGARGSGGAKPGDEAAQHATVLRFSQTNAILVVVGIALIVIGYVLLAEGSVTLAPILLVLGYVVLLPLAIVL